MERSFHHDLHQALEVEPGPWRARSIAPATASPASSPLFSDLPAGRSNSLILKSKSQI
jgi:hypothetical protein